MNRFQIADCDARTRLEVGDEVQLLDPVGSREAGTHATVKWIGRMVAVIDFGGGGLDGLDAVVLDDLQTVTEDLTAVG